MKYLLVLVFVLSSAWVWAQGNSVTEFDDSLLESIEAFGKLDKITETSEAYLKQESFITAQQFAKKWYTIATSSNLKEHQALALHYEGRALFGLAKKEENKDLGKQAFEKFNESNQILKDSDRLDIKIKNLNYLQSLANRAGRNRLVRKYKKEIKALNIELLKQAKMEVGKREDLSNHEFLAIVHDIVNNPKTTEEENEELANELDALGEERQQLEKKLAIQQVAFDQLSKDQLTAELLLSKQRQWVDSLNLRLAMDSLTILNNENMLRKQEADLALQRSRKKLSNSLVAIVILVAIGLFFRFWETRKYSRQLEEKNELVKNEQARSDQLLHNILPVSIANELKNKGSTTPRKYESVSVLFTDFVAFSKISEQLTEVKLIHELDYCFKAFDGIIRSYGLEKIKTIGDAYMCACGLPEPQANHAQQTVRAAIAMQEWLKVWNQQKIKQGAPVFEARIGIHTGSVIAGVVGNDKFAYDIWGDTVNIAARIETASDPYQVNISAATFQCIKDEIPCSYRGQIPTKNKGNIDMYYVVLDA